MRGLQTDRAVWDRLLEAARAVHQNHGALTAFCPFPDDITPQEVIPFDIPAARLMAQETGLFSEPYNALRDSFLAAGPQATWRETYKGTDIAQDFMDRFACYCLIGEGGAFMSDKIRAWVVYMPPQLYYPWHYHPAEEMYLTLAGEAEFMVQGAPTVVLRPGGTSQHASNQPHAMETHGHPVMAYVVWRNGFDTLPELTREV